MSTALRRLKSPNREPSAQFCPHRPPCPGCPRFGEPGIEPSAEAALNALGRKHGLPQISVVVGARTHFRERARLAIRGRVGSPKLGLFERGTHRVVHIPSCVVHHPLINRVAETVRGALVESKVTCYSDQAHAGLARYLQVVIERSSQTAQVVLVSNSPEPEPLGQFFELVRERLGRDLHSLWWNENTERSNAILGSEFRNICGPPSVVEHFGGRAVHYPPGAFGQNNLEIAERIIEALRAEIPDGARVTEFYAGVGAIGLSIVERAKALLLNEISSASLLGLELGLSQLPPAERAKLTVISGSAARAFEAAAGADVVIADPPRKGLDPELTGFLVEQPPERFLYVSCGLDSFLRDAQQLLSSGRLRLSALSAFSLLPYTEHVETLARFERC